MTGPELDALDRARTAFVLCLSPLELHGPHLPLGTDVFIAREVARRVDERLARERPDLALAYLPPAFIGSDTIPGSVAIDSRAVFFLLRDTAAFLAGKGFSYLLVVDNHGGPRHQIATAKAVRRAWRAHRFHIVAPFLAFYRRMVQLDPDLLARVGAGAGAIGDVDDCHAGTNETSLALACMPERVRPSHTNLARASIARTGAAYAAATAVARALRAIGARALSDDLRYAGTMLAWSTSARPPTYVGDPSTATPAAGDRMLDAFADEAVAHLGRAFAGEPPFHTPLGWTLRFVEPSR